VEKGIQETRVRGYLAGFPMVDFRVTVFDGSYHDVDSNELSFKMAGRLAFKDAMTRARPTILEEGYSIPRCPHVSCDIAPKIVDDRPVGGQMELQAMVGAAIPCHVQGVSHWVRGLLLLVGKACHSEHVQVEGVLPKK